MSEVQSLAVAKTSWWSRPAGGREVIKVSLPLVISSMSWTVMTFMDRVFLKWESGAAMSASFSASMLWFTVLCLPLGICMYCATFVSQYFGNHQNRRIGPAVWQGVWAACLISPCLMLAIPWASTLFSIGGHEPAIQELEIRYFRILCFGIPPILIAQALSAFYAGQGKTTVMMCVDSGVAIINLALDYAWIFGKWGFPALGIDGAGWATVTALWCKAAIYSLLFLRKVYREEFATHHFGFDLNLFKRLFYYGGPSGFQMFLDVTGFTVFIMLVGRLGGVEAEATSMAFSISTLAFMPVWGFAQAASILVGQRLGENQPDLSARATWTTLTIALSYMSLVSALYVLTPQLFLYSFFAGRELDGADMAVWNLSINLLRFVAAYNLLDATMMIFVSAIKGAGDTPFVLRVSLLMSCVLMGMSWLGVEVFHFGVYGCWAIITGCVWVLGLTYWWRFQQGKWRNMRVIEQVPLEPEPLDPQPELECTLSS